MMSRFLRLITIIASVCSCMLQPAWSMDLVKDGQPVAVVVTVDGQMGKGIGSTKAGSYTDGEAEQAGKLGYSRGSGPGLARVIEQQAELLVP